MRAVLLFCIERLCTFRMHRKRDVGVFVHHMKNNRQLRHLFSSLCYVFDACLYDCYYAFALELPCD